MGVTRASRHFKQYIDNNGDTQIKRTVSTALKSADEAEERARRRRMEQEGAWFAAIHFLLLTLSAEAAKSIASGGDAYVLQQRLIANDTLMGDGAQTSSAYDNPTYKDSQDQDWENVEETGEEIGKGEKEGQDLIQAFCQRCVLILSQRPHKLIDSLIDTQG